MAPPKSHAGRPTPGTKRQATKPLFGPAPDLTARLTRIAGAPAPNSRTAPLAAQLTERLREKYREYEHAALRLELRGEYDAANLLRAAAGRARLLKNGGAERVTDGDA